MTLITINSGKPWSSRSSKPQSQIDFLIVAPDLGVFVLEVKGGQISLRDGQWYSRGNNNEIPYSGSNTAS